MKKLSLELDELKVESFDTVAGGRTDGGTVAAHAAVPDTLPTNQCRYSICATCQFQCSYPECAPE